MIPQIIGYTTVVPEKTYQTLLIVNKNKHRGHVLWKNSMFSTSFMVRLDV